MQRSDFVTQNSERKCASNKEKQSGFISTLANDQLDAQIL